MRGPGHVWIDFATHVSSYVPSRPTDQEGRFEIRDLVPGRYRLWASDVTPRAGVIAGRDRQWASTEIVLGATDVNDVTMVLARGASLSGRVLLERTGRASQDARLPTIVRLFPLYASVAISGYGEELRATLDANGRFTLPALAPGRYSLDVGGQSVWRYKSAMLDGRDVFDTFVDVSSSDIDDLVITLTDSPTEISGHLVSAPRSFGAYTVIAFPAERPLPNLLSRRVVAVTLRSDTFTMTSLPAGKYLLAVLEDAEQGSWYDPKLLEALRPSGVPVTATDGQKIVQDLRVR